MISGGRQQSSATAGRACPCCGGALHQIGEDVAERLDVVPTTFRVLVTWRPRYGCRTCEGAVVQAPAPARIVEGGIPTEALIAQVLVSKYADHLPLYRQAQIYARQGIQLDRSTLANWVGRAAWYLRPLRDLILERLRRSERLFADETRWDGLACFLEDGRVELDFNTVERSIRPLALNRKNALFAGSDEGGDNWAVIATLIENCKLAGINPHAWLTHTLQARQRSSRQQRRRTHALDRRGLKTPVTLRTPRTDSQGKAGAA